MLRVFVHTTSYSTTGQELVLMQNAGLGALASATSHTFPVLVLTDPVAVAAALPTRRQLSSPLLLPPQVLVSSFLGQLPVSHLLIAGLTQAVLSRPAGLRGVAQNGVILALEGPQPLSRPPSRAKLTTAVTRAMLPLRPRLKRRSLRSRPKSPTPSAASTSDAPAPAAQRSSGRCTYPLPTSSTPLFCSSSWATGTWVYMSGRAWPGGRWCRLSSSIAQYLPPGVLTALYRTASTEPEL